MVRNEYYGLRHDVWGLGILTYFLFSGRFPFDEDTDEDNIKRILNKEPDWGLLRKKKLDPRIIELIKTMLIKEPGKRATIRQIMSNKLFEFVEKTEPKVECNARKSRQSGRSDFPSWIILRKWTRCRMQFLNSTRIT